MPDRWGRPTFDDGFDIIRGFAVVQGQQHRQWQRGQEKAFTAAAENMAGLSDEQALSFQPKTYAEHVATASRIKMIGSNQANRQVIDQANNQKALEAYKTSTAAFDEARNKNARGDFKGASSELVKIGQITNSPFKARPSEDGKTVEVFFTKDGEDQPGKKYPIDEALQVVQQHLSGDEFFQAHLQNREARKKLNEESVVKPLVFSKGKKELRAVRELDLNTNQVRWSVYDDKGNLYGGKPISDINELRRDGWKQSDTDTDAALKREKLKTGIAKDKAQIDKIRTDISEKTGETELQKREQREERLKYVDSAIKAVEKRLLSEGEGEQLEPEERKKITTKAEARYNQEVLRWTPVGKNRKTGEVMYKTPEGVKVNKYGQGMRARAKARPTQGADLRADGTKKGPGFLGELKRPDGKVSTEISIGVELDGKETEIPTLVPTLTKDEIKHLLSGKKPTEAIVKKAVKHARERIALGKSPFQEAAQGEGGAATDKINPR